MEADRRKSGTNGMRLGAVFAALLLLLPAVDSTAAAAAGPVKTTAASSAEAKKEKQEKGEAAGKREKEEDEASELTLFVAADLHYISPDLTDGGAYFTRMVENADAKFMQHCEEITECFAAEVIEKHPDGLILAGDLTFNGARKSHEDLAEKLLRIEEAGIPVYVIPGNHDLANRMAARFHGDGFELVESIGEEEFAEIYGAFGWEEAEVRDEASFSYLADFGGGYAGFFADCNVQASPYVLTVETLAFAESALAEAVGEGKKIIGISHQSLFPHNILFSEGYAMVRGKQLQKLYEDAGVLLNLSGHMHIQNIASASSGLCDVATSALVTYPFHYGVLTFSGSGISYEARSVSGSEELPLPKEILTNGRKFLWDNTCRQVRAGSPDLSEELRLYLAKASTLYAAGRKDMIHWDQEIDGEDAYEQWQHQMNFFSVYLWSLRDEEPADDTKRTWRYGDGLAGETEAVVH